MDLNILKTRTCIILDQKCKVSLYRPVKRNFNFGTHLNHLDPCDQECSLLWSGKWWCCYNVESDINNGTIRSLSTLHEGSWWICYKDVDVLRSSGISRKSGALIVRYIIARKKNECFSFYCSENPLLITVEPLTFRWVYSKMYTSPNVHFNKTEEWQCHMSCI